MYTIIHTKTLSFHTLALFLFLPLLPLLFFPFCSIREALVWRPKIIHFWSPSSSNKQTLCYFPCGPPTLDYLAFNFPIMLFWPLFLSTMTFKPLFGQITILSLSLENFRVSRFCISHLTHETFKLCLQNTLNMSKTTRVYFGVLHSHLERKSIVDKSMSTVPY